MKYLILLIPFICWASPLDSLVLHSTKSAAEALGWHGFFNGEPQAKIDSSTLSLMRTQQLMRAQRVEDITSRVNKLNDQVTELRVNDAKMEIVVGNLQKQADASNNRSAGHDKMIEGICSAIVALAGLLTASHVVNRPKKEDKQEA